MSLENFAIYQLLDSKGPGGIESHVLVLSKWLKKHGYLNTVVFLKDHGDHPLKLALSASGIKWQCLDNIFQLNHLLTRSPSLLCTHGYKAGVLGRLLSRFNKVPVVSTYHSGDPGTGRLRFYTWIDEITAPLCNCVISVSTEISKKLRVKSQLINNFVSVENKPILSGQTIAFVGRLSLEKGPDSFAKITKGLDAQIHIYGDGPEKKRLVEQYNHIKFLGHVDMSKYWKNIGLLCVSSKYEGLPLAALEAMSKGIPVACFSVGDLPKLISNPKLGWVVPANDVHSLRSSLKSWLNMEEHEKKILSNSVYKHIVNNYSDEVTCPSIVNTYRKAIVLDV